jgi:monoamine oxidase
MNFVETDMNNAVMEILREDLEGAYVDMQTIDGGMDQLPDAFFRELQGEIRFGAEVHAVEQTDDAVTVHFKTESGRFHVTGDYCVCTLPFPVLRTVETVGHDFSHDKRRAIRQLNYHASTKVLFQVRHRFWEQEDGIVGGGATVTDLPIRRMNYPPSSTETERGVLLASYSWGQDALQWGAMDPETRLEEALDDVSRIHPRIREEFEVGTSHAWYGDRWARGAFALFAPDQQTELQAAIVEPEGRIHFAGEHCSLYHAWIQGALESGIRAAKEIHEAPATVDA